MQYTDIRETDDQTLTSPKNASHVVMVVTRASLSPPATSLQIENTLVS